MICGVSNALGFEAAVRSVAHTVSLGGSTVSCATAVEGVVTVAQMALASSKHKLMKLQGRFGRNIGCLLSGEGPGVLSLVEKRLISTVVELCRERLWYSGGCGIEGSVLGDSACILNFAIKAF